MGVSKLLLGIVFCFLSQFIQANAAPHSTKADCSVTIATNIEGVQHIKSGVTAFIVTATFPEKMKTGTVPISFSPDISFAYSNLNINWQNGETTCVITYAIRPSFSNTAYNVYAEVINAEAESGTSYTCHSNPFHVDKTPPASNVSTDPVTINPQAIAQEKKFFKVTVNYYLEDMNTGIFPDISFDPGVAETLDVANVSKRWTSARIFEFSYPIILTTQQRETIKLQVDGGQDLVGNQQGTQTRYFDIEMAQAVTGINFIATPDNGANVIAGTTSFAIQLVFTEEMKNDLPTITFASDISPTLTEVNSGWEPGNKIYTVNYTVNTASVQHEQIQVTASGAISLDGNPARPVNGSFWIDFVKPACSVNVNPALVLTDTEKITVVATYDKMMADDVAPVITFPPVSATIGLLSGTWNEAHTQYTAEYTISQGNAFATGNVTASGAKDVAGNEQIPNTAPITIDQRLPVITSVNMTPAHLLIDVATAELKIVFDMPMDPVTPNVIFNPEIPQGMLMMQTTSWSVDRMTCTIDYTFNDKINFKQDAIGITISEAKNEHGNKMTESAHPNVFAVDVLRPACTGLIFDPPLIDDAVTSLTVTITYDTDMIADVAPVIDFISTVGIGGTLTLSGTTWPDARTCVLTYDVADQDLQVLQIRGKVTGAKSVSDNMQAEYISESVLDIDMLDILVNNLVFNTQQLDCSNNQFIVTVEFNQVMQPVIENIISFPDYDPAGYLIFESIEWDNEARKAIITYQAHANVATNVDNASIQIGSVNNIMNRPFAGTTFADQFSAHVAPPTLSISETSPLCHDELNGYIHLDVSGGVSPYTYEWGKDGEPFGDNLPDQDNLTAGNYTAKVTDNAQCYTLHEATLVNPEAIVLVAEVTQHVERADDGTVRLTVTGGTPPYTYYTNGMSENDRTEITNLPIGSYTFEVSDINNCKSAATTEIKDYRTPTAFTPNGDGHNDIFMEGNKVKIFDRNGTLVYEGDNGWNGDYKSQAARPAVYFYIVVFADGTEKKGTIQLFKK